MTVQQTGHYGFWCAVCDKPIKDGDSIVNLDGLDRAHSTCVHVPDWTRTCETCGETPIVPITGLCGPCTFGEADTAGGNW